MAKGNKGFADLLAGDGGRSATRRLPPRTGILEQRENRLAALATGTTLSRMQELVDPRRCRIWDGHNRNYAALDEVVCADLIDSLRAQGKQEVAAIVRRVAGDPEHDYEVICGARRHWSITWLRAHDRPEIRFLVEPRELSDEEAFRVADLENRSRKDLTDFERASDYARAVELHYGGNQGRMAERLQVSQSWLSRYLELARLPPEILQAFGASHAVGISHAASLAPLLRVPVQRKAVLDAARLVAEQQGALQDAGKPVLSPAAVLRRLTASPRPGRKSSDQLEHRDAEGRIVAKASRARGGALTIVVPRPRAYAPGEVVAAVSAILERLNP